MTMTRLRIPLTVVAVAMLVTVATAAQQGPPMPKPGPEHALFKMDEGTWDATIEFFPAPGAPAMTSMGVEVNTIGCSGLCLITDFKGEAMGAPFAGHGVMTWDATQKKYIGSWMDSLSFGLSMAESTYDAATRKWTGSMNSPDGQGKMIRMRSVVEVKGTSTRVFSLYGSGPDGKEMMSMRITYTKRK
jgi:hypothetical protein